jgi:hypothetical protein
VVCVVVVGYIVLHYYWGSIGVVCVVVVGYIVLHYYWQYNQPHEHNPLLCSPNSNGRQYH